MRQIAEIERRIALAQGSVTQAQAELNDALINGADTVVPREILNKANTLLSLAIEEKKKHLAQEEKTKRAAIQVRAKKILHAAKNEIDNLITPFNLEDSFNVTHI